MGLVWCVPLGRRVSSCGVAGPGIRAGAGTSGRVLQWLFYAQLMMRGVRAVQVRVAVSLAELGSAGEDVVRVAVTV
ncbi:hypothetical protein GCM10010232_35520 [Streptomyces amakusaensis]